MNNLTKVSDIDVSAVTEYCNLATPLDTSETNLITSLITIAKAYIKSYTGLDDEGVDDLPDLIIVALIIIQDMWDNRTYYVDSQNVNRVCQSILDLHSINLV